MADTTTSERRPYLGGVLAAAAGLVEPAPYRQGVKEMLSVLPRVAALSGQTTDQVFADFIGFFKDAAAKDGLPEGVIREIVADAERAWAEMEGERA